MAESIKFVLKVRHNISGRVTESIPMGYSSLINQVIEYARDPLSEILEVVAITSSEETIYKNARCK